MAGWQSQLSVNGIIVVLPGGRTPFGPKTSKPAKAKNAGTGSKNFAGGS